MTYKWLGNSHAPATFCIRGIEKFMAQPSPTPYPPLVCWNCQERTLGTHFCASCGKLRQVSGDSDYFGMFEMPRRLWIDMNGLEQKFLQLSWKLHPDNFVNAAEHERDLSLKRKSSELNDAYRTLHDQVARVEYLLALEGMRKEGEQKQQAPPELLEEVFELNESLDELREARQNGGDLTTLKSRLDAAQKNFQAKLAEVDTQLQSAAQQWDAALDSNAGDADQRAILIRLNELLNRRSQYIRNLVTGVAKELGET